MHTLNRICTQPAGCSLNVLSWSFHNESLYMHYYRAQLKQAKTRKNPFTHHIAEDIIWLFLEHLIKKLFDSFWDFILVKISHSFAFFLQSVSGIFYRHLESPRQLKSFTKASLWCTWSIIPVPSQFSVAFYGKEDVLFILICNLLCVAPLLLLSFAYLGV